MRADFSDFEYDRLTDRELDVLHRIADGSSDEEIAEELFLSINTIKWHNRNIYAKLGVESRTQALVAALELGLLDRVHVQKKPGRGEIPNNLPAQVSSFVGREVEIQAVLDLLPTTRLLTLTGTAGVGKTRLAIQAARRLVGGDHFPDGIFLIELAPIQDPEGTGSALVKGLNLVPPADAAPAEFVRNYCRSRQLLLLMDNFEHLLPAAPLVHELLSAAPGLKVLATSREALRLAGEHVYSLDPLPRAEPGRKAPAQSLIELDSVELFLQRARAVEPGFSMVDRNIYLVSEICTHLDGLPLALELAAGRMNFFRPREMLDQLEDRFKVLKDGTREAHDRHQTLEKAIDWSYQLLSPEERILFNRLSVFQGGRTFEAADRVCCFDLELDVLDGLGSLYAKNLIQGEEGFDGETRFTMLETLHAFARDRLAESGEADQIKDRHAVYFTELLEKARPYIRGGPEQIPWLKKIRSEHTNLRTAFSWSAEGGDPLLGFRMVGCLDPYWEMTGTGQELKSWLGYCLEMSEDAPAPVRARIYSVAGSLYFYARQYDLSHQFYRKALDIFQEERDKVETAWTLSLLISLAEEYQAIHPETYRYYQQGLSLCEEAGDLTALTMLHMMYGKHQERTGNLAQAKEYYQKAQLVAERNCDQMQVAVSKLNLGGVAYWEGEMETSLQLLTDSLRLEHGLGYLPVYTVGTLISIAHPCEALGHPRRAAVLLAAGCTHILEGNWDARPKTKEFIDKLKKTLREELGPRIFQQTWAEGTAMTALEAIDYALEDLISGS